MKLIEGIVIPSSRDLNTENLLFVMGGAFTGIDGIVAERVQPVRRIGFTQENNTVNQNPDPTTEDFISYGLESELLGRITRQVRLSPLSRDDLRNILLDSEISAYRKYWRFFNQRGVMLDVLPAQVERWLDLATEMGTGARGLQSAVEANLEPLLLRLVEAHPKKQEVWHIG